MKTTREGRRFVLAAFLIAIAAVNTGNNLIYLVLALMFSVALLAVVLLKVNLSRLTMEVSYDGPVFAGETAYAVVLVRNDKRLIPSYSVSITAEGSASPVYCPVIPAGTAIETTVRLRFDKRGLHGKKDFFAESSFPFILLKSRRPSGASSDILVYPAIVETGGLIAQSIRASGARAVVRGSSGDEIYSIREYRYGDDRRMIHWKASAKKAGLMVKEYAEGEYRRATIVVDNLGVAAKGPFNRIREREPSSSAFFEKVVSLAASLSQELIQEGYLVRLMSCRKVVPFGGGRDHLLRILDILAVIEEEPSWDSPLPGTDDFIVYVFKTRRGPSNLPVDPEGALVYADSL